MFVPVNLVVLFVMFIKQTSLGTSFERQRSRGQHKARKSMDSSFCGKSDCSDIPTVIHESPVKACSMLVIKYY